MGRRPPRLSCLPVRCFAARPGSLQRRPNGWDSDVPATTIDRQCGSSQQSIHFAAQGEMAGAYDLVVASGVESMTRVPMFSSDRGSV